MPTSLRWSAAALALLLAAPAFAAPPVAVDNRLVIELVAAEPDIVTPTGLAVDGDGRVWVIENNTHQRPAEYKGHPSDRIKVFSDFDPTGKARKVETFADGFKNAMGLAVAPDGAVYLATRSEIFLLRGKDGKAEEKKSLLKLDTPGNYPHNGLCGFAFDGVGNLYFGMGENLGAPYKLIGSDGTTLTGGGEGGNLFACRPDGSKLARVATGFWNPFHHCTDAFGRVFVVDNDPDARGPCRLLHAVQGGDYGYRFRYGRRGTHPFQGWTGDLPGTLGMVAGTGEAPSGVVAYESTNLPAEYRGDLLATSWGDHIIERFHLVPNGATFTAKSQTIVRGGEDFRPVAVAVAPDGTVYVSDWVDKSYPVHGKGRIWRIRAKDAPADDGLRPGAVAALEPARQAELLGHPRRDIREAATAALAAKGATAHDLLAGVLQGKEGARAKLAALWAAGRIGENATDLLAAALGAAEPEVRAEAVRLLPDADGKNEARFLDRVQKDASAAVRMQAILRLHLPESLKEIVPLLGDKDPAILSAAIFALGKPGNAALLLPHVEAASPALRLGVLLALRQTGDADGRAALASFLKDADPEVRRTAIQWVGEEKLKDYADQLQSSAAQAPTNRRLFLAMLAANHLLSGGKPDAEPANEGLLVSVLGDEKQPSAFRVLAMQALKPDHALLSADNLGKFVDGKEPALRRAALRVLSLRGDKKAEPLLLKVAGDPGVDRDLRAEAVLGLAAYAETSADAQRVLFGLLDHPDLRFDALRSLRPAARTADGAAKLLAWYDGEALSKADPAVRREAAGQLLLALKGNKAPEVEKRWKGLEEAAEPRPKALADWAKMLAAGGGDAAAGERVFFHQNGARCYTCHRSDSRGGKVGPDLSTIGAALTRERLVESILEPSKEIAPMFVTWTITTRDGKVHTGVVVDEGPDSTVTVADAQGKTEVLKRLDIEDRVALPTSLMPDNLYDQMTPQEFRDLLAFLASRK